MKIIKKKVKNEINTIKRKIEILKKRQVKKKINSFFEWIKGAELVELKS